MKTTDETAFQWVVRVLEGARGEENAWTLDRICEHLHLGRRDLEHLIETRLRDFPFAVCSTSKGYFRPANADEANASRHYKMTRFAKLQARIETEQLLLAREGMRMENGRFIDAPRQAELFGLN
jgi:hypothetical protein